ncbi:MAG: hypothetical protein L0H19_01655, partial [Salinisphaera sp.]|nr:hypothetical protein [Salinisphaera sp.]
MKRLHYACIGAALFACASTAAAQDPVGNVYLALDNLVLNLDGLLDNLAAGDIEGGLQGLGPTVAGLLTDLSQDTALEGLAQTGATLTLQISELGDPVYGIVGSLGTPVVEILAPVLDVYANLGTLDHGLPFINGREIVFFQPAVADALQSATGLPVPIAAELLGSNGTLSQLLGPILAGTGLGLGNGLLGGDGGLLGGSGGGLPLVGDLLGGNLLGGLLGGEGGLLGGLLGGGAGGLPIVGGLLGGGLLS